MSKLNSELTLFTRPRFDRVSIGQNKPKAIHYFEWQKNDSRLRSDNYPQTDTKQFSNDAGA